jgi:hypothetical protein
MGERARESLQREFMLEMSLLVADVSGQLWTGDVEQSSHSLAFPLANQWTSLGKVGDLIGCLGSGGGR